MGPIGSAVFGLGILIALMGIVLLILGPRSRGSMRTRWGAFSGPVWFIFMAFGFVLMVIGEMSPI